MRTYLSIAFIGLSFYSSAQSVVTYPYNPDFDDDSYVATTDMLETLSHFGADFEPNEIVIDTIPLDEFLLSLQAQVNLLADQSAAISLLESTVAALTATIEVQDVLIGNLQIEVAAAAQEAWIAMDQSLMAMDDAMIARTEADMARMDAMMAMDEAMIARMDAQTAMDQSTSAQATATSAESTAMNAQADAQMAMDESMMARMDAMMAMDDAMFARTEADMARMDAMMAMNEADMARMDAQTAMDQSTSAQADAQSAQSLAQAIEVFLVANYGF